MMIQNESDLEKYKDLQKQRLSDYFSQYLDIASLYFCNNGDQSSEKILPRNGYCLLSLPFSSDQTLRYRFAEIDNETMRVGKLLELMDYCAGISSFKILLFLKFKLGDFKLVTASMDNVKFFTTIPLNKDLHVQCYPTWSSRTSMEIRIDLIGINEQQKINLHAVAFFLMVAKMKRPIQNRNNENQQENPLDISKDQKKSKTADEDEFHSNFRFPEFGFEGESNVERGRIRFEQGRVHQNERLSKLHESVFKLPPTAQESIEQHKLFLQGKVGVKMNRTKICNIKLLQFQDKNIYNKVFGGVVLRESYDLAYTLTLMYSNQIPKLYHIDDVNFFEGADVGTILKYDAMITYVEKYLIHIKVKISRIKPENYSMKEKNYKIDQEGGDSAN